MEQDHLAEKITPSEVVESLLESPLSRQLTDDELAEYANQIIKMVNQNE
ncbi:MAG: hypothetical protein HY892_09415 [Deltaproteobacteria bacterium]|nr:hypothetical protein [Deltaproteobacteria bacterium]